MITKLVFCFLLVLSGCQELMAQQQLPVLAGLKTLRPVEKLYLQTDKDFYLTGEICWFKVYSMDADSARRLDLSSVSYIEVLDAGHKAVLQAKVHMVNGEGAGSFYLPLSLKTSNYQLRAYTSLMRNFGAEYYFSKTLSLVNPVQPPEGLRTEKKRIEVSVYPEGGELVNGLDCRLAFKVTDNAGSGIQAGGALLNEVNDTLSRFQSFRNGMGSFSFRPEKTHTYHILVRAAGIQQQLALPLALEQGFNLSVTDSSTSWKVMITSSRNPGSAGVFLCLLSGTKVSAVWVPDLSSGRAALTIDKSICPAGVSLLTLFNADRQAVAERMVYKEPASGTTVGINGLQPSYRPRSAVNLGLSSTGARLTSLSVSVTRNGLSGPEEGSTMLTRVYLQSAFTASVEDPLYYLKAGGEGWHQAIDNLMMVNGWRRFKREPAGRTVLAFLAEPDGQVITGSLLDAHTSAPVKDILTYLSAPGRPGRMFISRSDSTGKLLFFTHGLSGGAELIAQYNTLQGGDYRIRLEDPFSIDYSGALLKPLRLDYQLAGMLGRESISMQVQNVFYAPKLSQLRQVVSDSSAFYGIPDLRYKLDEFTRFTTLAEVVREYVRRTQLTIHQDKYQLRVLDSYDKEFYPLDPLILYDGLPVFAADQMIRLNPLKIKQVDVVSRIFYDGPFSSDGIISFNSYKGDFPGLQLDPRTLVIDYEGLQNERIFYAPSYANQAATQSRLPDFRSTLSWTPRLIPDPSGKSALNFYTSDLKGVYDIVVEGIGPEGPVHQQFKFEVKK